MKKARIAINGFGRIGRLFLRAAIGNPAFEVAAINDLGDVENLAYLLKYDTVYGRYNKDIRCQKSDVGGKLIVDGKEIVMLQEKDPSKLPWKGMQIDVVVEATGIFESYEKAGAHLAAGAQRIVLTAPAKDGDGADHKTILMGVNEGDLKGCTITSNASCTTNSAASVMQVLSLNPGIKKALLGTVHALTSTQNLADGPTKGKDFRRGRAAGANIAPSSTGAAIAVARAVPALEGKFDGIAYRVPVAVGSLSDITFVAKRTTSAEEINGILSAAAAEPRWQGILAVTNEQLVSSDIIGRTEAAIIDLSLTKVVDGDLVKVLAWYDNEAGYVATLVKHVEAVAAFI